MADYLIRPKQAETSMLLFYGLICIMFCLFVSSCFSGVSGRGPDNGISFKLGNGAGARKEGKFRSVISAGHSKQVL